MFNYKKTPIKNSNCPLSSLCSMNDSSLCRIATCSDTGVTKQIITTLLQAAAHPVRKTTLYHPIASKFQFVLSS